MRGAGIHFGDHTTLSSGRVCLLGYSPGNKMHLCWARHPPGPKALEFLSKAKEVQEEEEWYTFLTKAVKITSHYNWTGSEFLKELLYRSYGEHIIREFHPSLMGDVWFNPQVPQDLRFRCLRKPVVQESSKGKKALWLGRLWISVRSGSSVLHVHHQNELGRVKVATAVPYCLSMAQLLEELNQPEVISALSSEIERLNLEKRFGRRTPFTHRPVAFLEVKNDKVLPMQATGTTETTLASSSGTQTGRDSGNL